jgi:hypothetical protein
MVPPAAVIFGGSFAGTRQIGPTGSTIESKDVKKKGEGVTR